MSSTMSTENVLYDLAAQAAGGDVVEVPPQDVQVPEGCLLDVLGIRLTHIGKGRSRTEMTLTTAHLNQRGLPQGGALVALADAAAGWASYAALEDGLFTTLELKTNLLGRSRTGDTLVARCTPVHLGRTTLVLQVDVLTAEQEAADSPRLVARFSCTQMVLKAS